MQNRSSSEAYFFGYKMFTKQEPVREAGFDAGALAVPASWVGKVYDRPRAVSDPVISTFGASFRLADG